jgi:PAS domain S-box-containing protein
LAETRHARPLMPALGPRENASNLAWCLNLCYTVEPEATRPQPAYLLRREQSFQRSEGVALTYDTLNRQIETAQAYLDAFRDCADQGLAHDEKLRETMEGFAVVLEELYVAQEELHHQNEELVAAHEMAEQERLRYRELFDLAPDAYLVTDQEGIIQEANSAALTLLNVPVEFVIGKPLAALVHSEDRKAFRTLVNGLVWQRDVQSKEQELRLQPRDRLPVTVALTASAHDANGHVTLIRWLVRDLTASKRAEERERLLVHIAQDRELIADLAANLGLERDILDTIMENTHAQLAYLDRDFSLVRVNSAYAQGSGYREEELIGRNHFALFPNAENEAIFEGVRDLGQPVHYRARPFEYQDQPARGTTYWDWTLVPVKDAEGQVQGLVLSLLDVTAAEWAKQERAHNMARLNRLMQVSQSILAEKSAEGVLQRTVDAGRELTAAGLGLASYEFDGNGFRLQVASPQGKKPFAALEDAVGSRNGRLHSGLLEREPSIRLTAEQCSNLPSWRRLKPDSGQPQGLVAARLVDAEGLPCGFVLASEKQQGEFTAEDEALLVQLAALASLGLQHIEARRAAEHQAGDLSTVLGAMVDAVVVCDANGTVVQANAAAARAYGIEAVEAESSMFLVGHPRTGGGPDHGGAGQVIAVDKLSKRYPDGRRASADELPSTRSLGGERVENEVFGLTTASGEEREVLVSAAPLMDEGQITGAVLTWHDVTERERVRRELERLAARDRAILESMSEGLIIFDLAGNILSMNPAALRIHGFERVEEAQRHLLKYPDVFQVSTLDGRQLPVEEWPAARVMHGDQFTDCELQVRRMDTGHAFVGRYGGNKVLDEKGRQTLGILTLHDVTAEKAAQAERERIQQALGRYAERLRVLHEIDQAVLAAQSVEQIANGALAHIRELVPCVRTSVALFDLEAGEAQLLAVQVDGPTRLAQGWCGPLEPDWPIEQLQAGQICGVMDTSSVSASMPLDEQLRAEGVRAYVNIPLLAQGQLVGALNLGLDHPGELDVEQMDVAQEMAAELAIGIRQMRLNDQVHRHAQELEETVARRTAALRVSEERLRTIFDGAAIGIALAGMDGCILESNPAFRAMLGYSRDELRGKVFAEFTHPEDIADDMDRHRELVSGERDQYTMEKRYVRKDGAVIWGNQTMSLVRGRGGQPLYAVGMIEDVTERKQFQEALLNAEKLAVAGRMGASLAHEINNPLQSVIGCLGLAEKSLSEGGDADRYLGVAREELRRAARIVGQLRDMSRPAGEERKEPVALNALVDEVLVLSRKQAQERRVHVIWEPAEALPVIQAAPDRLRQVFLNLALNAFDAMPKGGELRVRTVRSGSPAGVQVVFADTGVGMTSDTLSQLFDPFYTTKSQGLGLGLYICHNIVEEHGGHIVVTSRIGEGTTFTVWLPA